MEEDEKGALRRNAAQGTQVGKASKKIGCVEAKRLFSTKTPNTQGLLCSPLWAGTTCLWGAKGHVVW